MLEHVLETMNEVVSYDYNENHQALDIVSSDHTKSDIIALESGIVEEVVKNVQHTDHTTTGLATYGNYVKIKQSNGKTALYAHMEYGSINVNIGDYVEKGTIIGTMGQTGNAYGDHLHLEIKNESGYKENPIISLNETPQAKEEIKQTLVIENLEETSKKEASKEETPKEENSVQKEKTIKNPTRIKKASTKTPRKNTTEKIEYIKNCTYQGGSIVDGLKEIGIDSSYDYREKLAQKNGITDYHGSYQQNVKLLNMLKNGTLIKA